MKTFDGSLSLATPPLASASLIWHGTNAHPVTAEYPLTVTNNAGGTTSTVSTTAALPRGVLTLRVVLANGDCCPRHLLVWCPGCERTSLLAQHSAGSQLDTGPVPSCNPA